MFLLVLAVTFVAAKTVSKHQLDAFDDLEEDLVDQEEIADAQGPPDIFIIDDSEYSSYECEIGQSQHVLTETKSSDKNTKKNWSFTTLYNNLKSFSSEQMIKLPS